jgi:hypothetical protein
MNFLKARQFGALLFILVSLTVAYHLTFNVFLPASRPPLPGQPDIPAVILSYFTNATKMGQLWTDLLWGRGLQGSAIYVRYLFIPFFLLPLLYIAQTIIHRKRPLYRDYSLLYTSWAFLIFTMFWILLTATVNGIAQAEGWYWAKWPLNGGSIEVPGTFDVATHFMAGGVFIAVIYNFALAQWFGLDKLVSNLARQIGFSSHHWGTMEWLYHNKNTICELFDDFSAASVTYGISVWFESVEALHPEDYGTWTNLRGNSYSDLIAACFFALMWMAFTYRLLVPRAVRTYE